MLREILRKLSPILGLSLIVFSGCIKSVCETASDCPVGKVCNAGACIKVCAVDSDCLSGKYCDRITRLCTAGCRDSSECPSDHACVHNKCWPVAQTDGGSDDDGGAPVCSCLQAPRACLVDINPASSTLGSSLCAPGDPPRATAMFFGNVGCSHCQSIFGHLLEIESQLRSEGFDPTLTFVQIKDWDYTGEGEEVASTFPKHRGPVLQDTVSDSMWKVYGADWYDVKIIDTHGCLSAFFSSPDTMSLISNGSLQTSGTLVKEAWRSAMSNDCHVLVDAGAATGSGI